MKELEIKAMREADTIEAVLAMVDRSRFKQYAKEETAQIQHYLLLQYNTSVLSGMREAAALNHAKASVVCANGGTARQQSEFWRASEYTKAMDVEQAYDAAQWDNISSEGCYSRAIAAAHEFGGVEVYNSNEGSSTISFAPTRTFEFDDSSSAQVTYGGVFVVMPNRPY